ncbi:hypothetical protein SAZ11_03905 [Streptomyces sp. FXJ1.4098]|nr:hypothetical protein [Streptomyces sp. FXJ1.4098]
MGGDAEDMDGAGAHLHDEQRVELLQADGVDMEEIGGEQAVGLGFEEGGPLAARRLAARGGTETGGTQYPPDGGGADFVPEAAQFAVHAAEPPSGVSAPSRMIGLRISSGGGGRPVDGGCVHFCFTRRWCQGSRVRGETIRCSGRAWGISRVRTASSVRSTLEGSLMVLRPCAVPSPADEASI